MDILTQPWHWAAAGVLIGLVAPVLLLLGNKKFGVSATLRHICAICIPANIKFFNYDWKKEVWNLYFSAGILIGSVIAVVFLNGGGPVNLSDSTKQLLTTWGITDFSTLMPAQIFSWDNLFTFRGLFFFVFGGFIVGFGTRYAGGCTSGHSILGISSLQWPSLVATICFMLGGILCSQFILPLIFK